MSKYSRKFKRALALVLTFVMAVSVITVTPSTNVEAASNKVVKSLSGVAAAKTMNVGETASFKANVKTTKKVAKNLLQVTVKSSDSSVVAAKVAAKPKNKKKANKGASTINLTAIKAGTATITVTTKAKNKKNKKVTKKMVVTVNAPVPGDNNNHNDNNNNNNTNEKPQTPPAKVSVNGVTLDAETLNLDVNKGSTLVATVTPANATDKSVVWTSDNNAVATVDAKGNVKAVAAGEATITVTTNDGGYQAYCKVTVKDSSLDVADGMTMTVTNALEDYSNPAKSDYVCLTGADASVRVKVIANGKPYTNQSVKLSMKAQYGNAAELYKIESSKLNSFVTTDEDGYATFPISLTERYNNASATSGYYQSYSLTAQLSSDTKVSTTATLSFGTVSLISPRVVYTDDMEDGIGTNLEPGQNAQLSGQYGVASVASKNNAYTQEYVTSQQVSSSNVDHSVTMATYPVIDLPRTASDVKTGAYEDTSFAKKSGEYSVYNDETNETTTTVIDTVPAGLEWAQIEFGKLDLSEYTKMVVAFYELNEDGSLGDYISSETKTSTNIDDKAKVIQIPIQDDVAVCAIIALYSEGQVNDDANDGYEVLGIKGEWASNTETRSRTIEVKDSIVTWSKDTEFKRATSDKFVLTYEQAKQYIPATKAYQQYLDTNYTYTYNVPAFPSVGNAIITVKDATGNDKAYFAYPIVNKNNTNDIMPASNYMKATLISKDEYQKQVGKITANGAFVTVNTTETGYTPLKANINLGTLGVSISNPDAYSSVQWAPFYEKEEEEEAVDFYALKGQKVNVTAKLYDTAKGNPVSQAGQELNFFTDNETIKNFAMQNEFKTSTDSDGEIQFNVKQSKDSDYIQNLYAETSGYKVKLIIGGKTVNKASIHWIEPGMYYKNDVDTTEAVTSYDNKTEAVASSRPVGNNWIFGMKTIGKIDTASALKNYTVANITGIKINFEKDGVGQINDNATANGQVKLKSEVIGESTLNGYIDASSVTDSSKVVFTIVEVDEDGDVVKKIGEFNNVGEGTPTMTASIALKVNWTKKGMKATVELPLGGQLDANTPSVAYVKVVDDYGNALAGEKVTYSLNELGAIEAVANAEAYTNEKGIVEIPLEAPGVTGSVTVTADIAGVSADGTVSYTVNNADAFGIVEATLNKANGTVAVKFTNGVNEASVDAAAFKILLGENTVEIKSASYDKNNSNTVILTLTKPEDLTNVDPANLTLKVAPYEKDGLAYQLKDRYNQIVTGLDEVVLK